MIVLSFSERLLIKETFDFHVIEENGVFSYPDGMSDLSIANLVGGRTNKDHVRGLRKELYGDKFVVHRGPTKKISNVEKAIYAIIDWAEESESDRCKELSEKLSEIMCQ